jgi:NADPH-dependent 2,4-dienoyl-CoA reductase/sulfur reductase-like enzyme
MSFERSADLVIVGGGPAGLAAAAEAGAVGLETVLIDERASLGGQIYKQFPAGFRVKRPDRLGRHYSDGRKLIDAAEASGTEIMLESVAWGIWDRTVAVYREGRDAGTIEAGQILLAPGAYDRPVVFPGWTLPGVISAGGAQALVKTQKVIPGERILMVGSGPLVLAFSAQLHQLGANVVGVVEAAPFPRFSSAARIGAAASGNVRQLTEGVGYLRYLRSAKVPYLYSHVIVRAEPGANGEVARAVVARVGTEWRPIGGTERSFDVDTICVGYGFFPSVELSRLCGCAHTYDENLGGYVPVRDADLRSSVPGILVAGDGAGVAGSAVAVQEGRLAAITAARDSGALSREQAATRARPVRAKLRRLQRFRAALNATYAVGPGIYDLYEPSTVVCRCEEVTAAEVLENIVAGSADPNSVKNVTRVGMGQCQGRNCARQVASLVAGKAGRRIDDMPSFSARPPVKPIPVALVAEERPEEARKAEVG